MSLTTDRGHHPDSPSGLQSSDACPFFENRQGGDSSASEAGTLQHAASETRDLSILDDPEQVEAVTRTIDMEDKWLADLKKMGAITVEVVREKYMAVCPEHEVVVEDDVGAATVWKGITGGYPDTLIVATFEGGSQLLVILDWKFGKMLVTATALNLQGKSYGLAGLQEYEKANEVLVIFYHPYIERDEPLEQYTHAFSRADMPQMELDIRTVVARKHKAKRDGWNGEIRPKACTSLCVWCAHLESAECPEVLHLATQVHDKHQQLIVPTECRVSYLSDPKQAKLLFQMTGVLEAYAKAARRRITDMVITEGMEIEGVKIVTKSNREIVSLSAVRDVALEQGVTLEQFESCLNLPITTLEGVIKDNAPKGKGAASIREFQAALDDCGAMAKGKPYSYLTEDKSKKEKEAIDV
jgi:hypothetical protein